MKHKELTEKIIGCAYRVYNKMGYGFLESVYEKCLLIELDKEDLQAKAQQQIAVFYEDKNVGVFIADIVVEDQVIIELKSIRNIAEAHEIQLVNYLTATKKDVGLILNFGENKVEVRRKVRSLYTDRHDVQSCESCSSCQNTTRCAPLI